MVSKKGQVTIFIIIAIVLVAALLLIFNVQIRAGINKFFVSSSPDIQLKNCLQDKVKTSLNTIAKQGGSINPVNSVMFEDSKVEYLCYTNQYYQTCAMQQPLLKQHIEREFLDSIQPEIIKCVESMKTNLEGRGYSVSVEKQDASVELTRGSVNILVSGISFVKDASGERYDKLEYDYKTKLYDLVMITGSILNWEARYGDSETTAYMIYYPNLRMEKFKQTDGSKIYKLTDITSKESFVFATRSLSWPGGYGIGEIYTPSKIAAE